LDKISLEEDFACFDNEVDNYFSLNNALFLATLHTAQHGLDDLPLSSDVTLHILGEIFTIAPDKVFDMITTFPNSLISMTHILQYFIQVGVNCILLILL
jgi:hypothetical protein